MTLAERLASDQRKAMLAGDSLRVSTIRLARASIQNVAIERGRDLTDAEVVEVLGREMKRRRESIEGFVKGGGDELVWKELLELVIFGEYVSGALFSVEVCAMGAEVITEVKVKDVREIGRVMGVV